jgi:hypothetical protein
MSSKSLITRSKLAGVTAVMCFSAIAGETSAAETGAVQSTKPFSESPIRGFFAFPDGGFVSLHIGTDFTDIQSLSLPAGKYILNASAVVGSNSVTPRPIQCIFMVDGFTKGEPASGAVGGTGTSMHTTLALTAGIRLLTRDKVTLACATDDPGAVFSQPSPITAIQVDRLTVITGLGFDPP